MNAVRRIGPRALAVAAFGLAVAAWPGASPPAEAKGPPACRPQKPQRFLERRSFVRNGMVDPRRHDKALQWLVTRYGNAGDERTTAWNPDAAIEQATTIRFFGMPVSMHEKVAPALQCVEREIRRTCKGKARYAPHAIGGFRDANTYRGPEVSNHLLGLAIDIDPEKNPCCGCVDPWPTNPLCRNEVESVYERTSLPKCWVRAFARYGFDWLGNDPLEDTMHFEFLGDPDKVTKK